MDRCLATDGGCSRQPGRHDAVRSRRHVLTLSTVPVSPLAAVERGAAAGVPDVEPVDGRRASQRPDRRAVPAAGRRRRRRRRGRAEPVRLACDGPERAAARHRSGGAPTTTRPSSPRRSAPVWCVPWARTAPSATAMVSSRGCSRVRPCRYTASGGRRTGTRAIRCTCRTRRPWCSSSLRPAKSLRCPLALPSARSWADRRASLTFPLPPHGVALRASYGLDQTAQNLNDSCELFLTRPKP